MVWRASSRARTGTPQAAVIEPESLPLPRNPLRPRKQGKGRLVLVKVHPREPDPRWTTLENAHGDWLKHRMREYTELFGYVSSGVAILLRSAAQAHADAEWVRVQGVEEKKPEWLKLAHAHRQIARGHELAAWEIAVRESRERESADKAVASATNALASALETTGRETSGDDGGEGQ